MRLTNPQEGFTLIELLVALAIISILVGIAVPFMAGLRDKARVKLIISIAKSSYSEIAGWHNEFIDGNPMLMIDASGNEICIERQNAAASRRCTLIYEMAAGDTYSDIDDIIDFIFEHHKGKEDLNPYYVNDFVFTNTVGEGNIVLTREGSDSIRIHAYARDTSSPIFNSIVH
jgi:prepilin-type N-terminal cleavage/methylation domain-containing protein